MVLALGACRFLPATPEPKTLTIFAAASLTAPFAEIERQFEADNPGAVVTMVFAGSQQLANQIREGAVVDVFASANPAQMESLIDANFVEEAAVRFFAKNRLVVIIPANNPAGIDDLQNLAQPGRKLVIAAPEVPVGQYTLEFLEKADHDGELLANYKELFLKNVVSYENDVKAVLAKVRLGEADAGIVYSSDVEPEIAEQVIRIEIPDRWSIQAQYPIATLAQSTQPELANAFITYVLSSQGQAILDQYGFQKVSDEPAAP
jgi:molybdate transport system substrate-binding protein